MCMVLTHDGSGSFAKLMAGGWWNNAQGTVTDHMWFSTGSSVLVPRGPFMMTGRLIATAVESTTDKV